MKKGDLVTLSAAGRKVQSNGVLIESKFYEGIHYGLISEVATEYGKDLHRILWFGKDGKPYRLHSGYGYHDYNYRSHYRYELKKFKKK